MDDVFAVFGIGKEAYRSRRDRPDGVYCADSADEVVMRVPGMCVYSYCMAVQSEFILK